jgi:CubicO group peptidase (beta-lactamase class C family)
MTEWNAHSFSRGNVTLANWRDAPYSSWSFQNVQEIVPSAPIAGNGLIESAPLSLGALGEIEVNNVNGVAVSLHLFLSESQIDSFVVMRKGEITGEWYAPTCDRLKPHLVFSVSKSITGILAGILEDQGVVSAQDLVIKYVPEAEGSAYGDATLRHLLDMEVALDFNEDYLDKTGGFDRYRRSTGWNPQSSSGHSSDMRSFLCTIQKTQGEHGNTHLYRSPNTDMAGIVLERAAGIRIPTLISDLIWKPMGAYSNAFVTVDSIGTSRVAGGMSVTPRDLARFGDMVRLGGKNVVSQKWIHDLWTGGSQEAWAIGDQADYFKGGSYRSYWYQSGQGELAAIGIHGQYIWIDATNETVIIMQGCHALPTDEKRSDAILSLLRKVAGAR